MVKNQKGQMIIIVLFIMSLALAVGVTVSSRFIGTMRNITESDNSNKALAIAEAAIEKVLLLPTATLEDYITNNSCGTDCFVEVSAPNGQVLRADVTLSHTGQTIDEAYPLDLLEAQTTEVFLEGYASGQNIYICWNTDASIGAHYIYSESGTIKSKAYAANAVTSIHTENNFNSATALFGYNNCLTLVAINTPLALRIKPYYRETEVFVVPAGGYGLPIQGIQIKSVGIAGNSKRTVTVVKTNSYVPGIFDYVLYQKSDTESLSN